MNIWQRGTSGFTTANNYCSDRWFTPAAGLTTVAQSVDVPAGYKYSLSVAGTSYAQIAQRIESFNCLDLVGQSVTLSFWAKQTTGAGTNSITIYYNTPTAVDNWTTQNTAVSATLNGSSSWTFYSYTFTSLPAAVANGIVIGIALGNGSNAFLVTGVQLEKGLTATAFDYRPYGTELQLCQRYARPVGWFTGQAVSATQSYCFCFGVPMRATPTLSTATGFTLNNASGFSLTVTSASVAGSIGGDGSIALGMGVASGLVAGNATYSYTLNSSNPLLVAEL